MTEVKGEMDKKDTYKTAVKAEVIDLIK